MRAEEPIQSLEVQQGKLHHLQGGDALLHLLMHPDSRSRQQVVAVPARSRTRVMRDYSKTTASSRLLKLMHINEVNCGDCCQMRTHISNHREPE